MSSETAEEGGANHDAQGKAIAMNRAGLFKKGGIFLFCKHVMEYWNTRSR
jgi:hypothetical protein